MKLGTPEVETGLRDELGPVAPRWFVEPPLTSAALRFLRGFRDAEAVAQDLELELSPTLARTRLFDGLPRVVVLDLLADLDTDVLVAPRGAFSLPGPAEGAQNTATAQLRQRGFQLRRLEPSESEQNLRDVLTTLRANGRTHVVCCSVFARLGSDSRTRPSRQRLVEYSRMAIRLSSELGVRIAHVHAGLAELNGSGDDVDYRCRGPDALAVVTREIMLALLQGGVLDDDSLRLLCEPRHTLQRGVP